WRLGRAFPGTRPRHFLGRKSAETKPLLRGGLWISLGNLALNLHYGADVLILGWFLGPSTVVIYTCTAKLISLSTTQVCGLATVAGPALSELRVSGRGGQLLRASTALGQLVLLSSGLVAGVILATNEGFVSWWVGPGLYGGTTLTLLLLGVMVARHLSFTLA